MSVSFVDTMDAIESLSSPMLFVVQRRFCFLLPTTNGFPGSKMNCAAFFLTLTLLSYSTFDVVYFIHAKFTFRCLAMLDYLKR